MTTTIIIALFAINIFYAYKFYNLKREKIVKEIDKDFIRLEIPKELPTFEDYDEKDTLLKDVIDSIKLEEWDVDIEEDRSFLNSIGYKIELTNPKKTLMCRSRIRYDYGNNKVDIRTFMIIKTIPGTALHSGSVSYELKKITTKSLVTNLLWSYILNYKNKIIADKICYYDELKKSIESELITLKRDKNINKLLT